MPRLLLRIKVAVASRVPPLSTILPVWAALGTTPSGEAFPPVALSEAKASVPAAIVTPQNGVGNEAAEDLALAGAEIENSLAHRASGAADARRHLRHCSGGGRSSRSS